MRRAIKAVGALFAVLGLAALRRVPTSGGAPGDARDAAVRHDGRRKAWLVANAARFAVLLMLLALGGAVVAVSGVMPIKASSGHWPITAWLLNFSMERSVSTHTIGMQAPPLDDPGLVLKGAGHYEIGCRPCHGSPELHRPRFAAAMTPHPPYLPPAIPQWEDEELFYIVKHGVKFTGMPAWPTQERDDEVWAMTAFLRALPEMDVDEYRRLARGEGDKVEAAPLEGMVQPDSVPRAVTESCARCHAKDGAGRGPGAYPSLAGQNEAYFVAAMRAYANDERHSGIMGPIAAGLSPDDWKELARYYGDVARRANRASAGAVRGDAAAIERGERIARGGIAKRRVPACVSCHGPNDEPRNPHFPALDGQYADYLALQLKLFKSRNRGGSPYADLMSPVVDRMTADEMEDVAAYYASLAPDGAENP